ncbi:sensor histidine kinase [Agromyces sp. MMS24-K17]|uniref:sensor histidine kinase n=1 Tax=Agromyces sp. MMS24-K17 TaxID=3372850 RepID=UPI003754A828
MLLLARADEAALRLDRRDVDLDDLLLEEAQRPRGDARITVDTSAITAVRVLGDRDLLRQLVRNLVDNAARAAASTVAFRLRSEGGAAILVVADDGPGIPAASRDEVFERFVRLDPGRARDHGGTGLGLAIVAEIARAHGGTASADADPELGGHVS